ncbi:hypothetical protein [Paenibacillus gansuensis]|uniref:ABC transporter permease n=1 Tax=Paenibacillus gansuensis TaxID=306542 RepID=A0ABW5PKW7_9BACL
MAAWTALFRKDFRLSRTLLLAGLVMNLLILVLALLMAGGDKLYVFIPLLAAVVFHIFYLPVLLFASLKSEARQLHIWLHHPLPAATLLLSKLLNGIVMAVISLVVLYSMAGMLAVSRFSLLKEHWTDIWMAGLLIFVHTIMISVWIGAWVILLWSLYHSLKHRIGRWTWAALLAAVILPGSVGSLITSTSLYKLVTQWGNMEVNFPTFPMDPIPTFAGEYLYYFVIIAGLVYVSSWIIDRKVEV